MPRYSYTALAGGGKTVKGTVSAESPYSARKQLRARGIHATNIQQVAAESEVKNGLMSLLGRTKKSHIIEFTKQMSILLNSDIKLTEALSVMIEQTPDARFKNVITDIRDRVVTGESFTDALGDYTEYFDVVYISMVRVGEATGTLGKTMETISGFMEKRRRIESKIMTAMIYPLCIVTIGMAAIIFLTTFVLPKIIVQIQKAGMKLPMITKILMAVSNILTSYWYVVLIMIFAIVYAIRKFLKTERGSYLRDRAMLSLPIFGPLIKQRVVSRFASTLSTLLGSGLSMAESLRVVAEVTGNVIMVNAVKKARDRILSGADIATPLRESGVISPAIAHMVAIGEKSGELTKMLLNISENLESSSDIVVERLSAALEPLIIVVMAFFVGMIALAALLPILRFSAGNF
ncbi:MAG: type II secretion system F family protein [Planctomycetes bacterium]|nr:type II secretion system F family protein [Planctomycetota bacterium]MBU1518158.1 type II secretion system F family protein [Planctomycetota bacterium]MBU2457105.1 type II secretion system F family protein [Planctomycetota bacterium]